MRLSALAWGVMALVDIFVTLGEHVVGRLVKEVEQFVFHRVVAVAGVVLAQLVHFGLEHIVIDLVMSQQAFLHVHALDGVCHIDFAGLEQGHAAHVVVHLGEPLGIAQQELVHQRAIELRYQEVALDFGNILGKALAYHVLESGGQEQEQQVEFAALDGGEVVWDLYCGIGTISLFLAQKAGHVYGVEVIPEAIEDAKDNARLNGLDNTTFFVGKAEEVLPDFCAHTNSYPAKHPKVIVVDPPRKGCDSACLETMVNMAPERIVYVSCDSATLARDLKYLTDNGFALKRVRPCDMFPMSIHVETVVLLTRQNT